MAGPDEEQIETPTQSREQAEEENAWIVMNWLWVAVVSIFALLVLVLGLMQATGVIDVLAPITDAPGVQWAVIALLALLVIGLGVWGWRSPRDRKG